MKKTIAATLIISIIMSLSMAFPASAATSCIDANGFLGKLPSIIDLAKSVLPSGYDYYAITDYGDSSVTATHSGRYRIWFTNTPVIKVGTQFYLYIYYPDNSSFGVKFSGDGSGPYLYTVVSINSYSTYSKIDIKTTGSPGTSNYHGLYQNISTANFSPEFNASLIRELNSLLNISALQALISQAKATQNTGYTQSSWNALQTQITAAENLLATTGYTQTQVDNAKNALQAALDGLVLLPDASALQALISQAKAMQSTGYTQSSWNTLQIQINAAENLLASSNYTQEQVNNMINALQTAISGLVLLPDTMDLQSLLAIADSIQNDGYSMSTWNSFVSARMAAYSLITSTSYTESDLLAAMAELQNAMNNLALLPDTSILESLIKQAQSYAEDKYTEYSMKILNSKIIQALALLDDKDYINSQVDKMISELLDAINGLVFESSSSPEPVQPSEPPSIDMDKYMWELTPEQKKYANLLNGVTTQHLEPVKQGVEENMSVARKYGFWVWLLILVPTLIVIIVRSFLNSVGSNVQLDMTHHSTGGVGLTAWKRKRDARNWEKMR